MVATFIVSFILLAEAIFIVFYELSCRIRDLDNKINVPEREDKLKDYRNERGLFTNKKR